MSRKLRVAIIGHGLIGTQRAEAVHSLRHKLPVRVASTVDPISRDQSLYGGAPHLLSQGDLCPSDYDCAIVALPHSMAAASALDVLAEGKPVLVEKPLGTSLDEARSVASSASRLNVPSFVGYNYRFLENVSKLIKLVTSGRLGSIRSIELTLGHGGNPKSTEGWKLDPVRAGGGVVIDPGVHMLDILSQLCTGLELRSVIGTTGFWGTGVEEDVIAVFQSDSTVASLRVSHLRWLNTMRIEVWGTEGYGIAEGRGGNYGSIRFRRGERWAWAKHLGNRSQADCEEVVDFGTEDLSLQRELEEVLLCWIGSSSVGGHPRPASTDEALRIAGTVENIYSNLDF